MGQTLNLVWAADSHSTYDGSDANDIAYIFHADQNDPDDSIFDALPYAQLDWNNCGANDLNIGVEGSTDPSMPEQGAQYLTS